MGQVGGTGATASGAAGDGTRGGGGGYGSSVGHEDPRGEGHVDVYYVDTPVYKNISVVTGTVTTTTTNTYADTYEQDLADTDIPICRPKFIFFKFENLRPNTAMWVFFDGKEVTKWVNTSYTLASYNSRTKNDVMLNPGEKYVDATAFPTERGGPTNSSGPVYTDATGTLEGCFYLQSNPSVNFSTGTNMLTVMDISLYDKGSAFCYAEVPYEARGVSDRYRIQVQYRTETSTKTEKVRSNVQVQVGTTRTKVTGPRPPATRTLLPGEPANKNSSEWEKWYRQKYGK